ncbi:MAG: cellulose biosynthesis cyclic di-GMP-binding regulatory protein BcsB [Nitrospinae bacterium]|nr:cellulose biosynthesis cyclic di-GMP-binding regulatory protein BcsB [Nitrospinota bacterium]
MRGIKEYEFLLKSQGYVTDIALESQNSFHIFYFKVPRDVRIHGGKLKIHYSISPGLDEHSNVQFAVNKTPKFLSNLAGKTSEWVEIPLSPEDLKKEFVQLTVRATLLVSQDMCLNQMISGFYLTVHNDSRLQLSVAESSVTTIRGYYDLLPDAVTVSVDPQMNAETFQAAVAMGTDLSNAGKKVSWAVLPEMGDFVVAGAENLEGLIKTRYPGAAFSTPLEGTVSGIALYQLPDKKFLHCHPAAYGGFRRVFSVRLVDLMAGGGYTPATGARPEAAKDKKSPVYSLEDLGFTDLHRWVSDTAEWNIVISPDLLSAALRPAFFNIDLVSTPSVNNQQAMLHVYLNDKLVKVFRVDDSGEPRRYAVPLPAYMSGFSNTFRVVLQRLDPQGDCRMGGVSKSFPAQILASTHIEFSPPDKHPERFSDLTIQFKNGFDLMVQESYLQNPVWLLTLLTRLFHDMHISPAEAGIVLYPVTPAEPPTRPFLLLGAGWPEGLAAPVNPAAENIRVRDMRKKEVFNVNALSGISIAQVASAGDQYGLWLMPPRPAESPLPDTFVLRDGDVAFLDQNGVVFQMSSTTHLLEVERAEPFKEWVSRYRIQIFLLAVILVSVLFFYLYRMFSRHKRKEGGRP